MSKFNSNKMYDIILSKNIPAEETFDIKFQSILKDFYNIPLKKLSKIETREVKKGKKLETFDNLECSNLINKNIFYNQSQNSISIDLPSAPKNFDTVGDVFYPILKGSRFGGSMKLLCNNSNKLIFLMPNELSFLKNGRLYFIFSKLGSIENGCYLDFDLSMKTFLDFYNASIEITRTEDYGIELIERPELLFLSNLSYKSDGELTLTGEKIPNLQMLELKYVKCLLNFYDNEFDTFFNNKFVNLYEEIIKLIKSNPENKKYQNVQIYISTLLKILSSDFPKNNFFHLFHNNEIIKNLINEYFKIPFQESFKELLGDKKFKEFDWLFHALLQFFLINTKNTNFGKKYPTLNRSADLKVQYISLTEEPVPNLKHMFWSSKRNKLLWELNYIHDTHDVPLKLANILSDLKEQTNKLNDIKSSEKVIHSLLEEASALQENHVPPGAFVQLQIGVFIGVKVYELGDEVMFKWVTSENNFVISSMYPSKLSYSFFADEVDEFIASQLPGQSFGFGFNQNAYNTILENIQKYLSMIYLVQASIIRDFWVVENRESVFQVKNQNNKNNKNNKPKTNGIIYLPRRRYINNINLEKFETTLNLTKRSAHMVSQHFRKSNPTNAQIQLAKLLGIHLPEGKTLIRQHYRGDGNNQKIYRSKSALFIIANNQDNITNEPSNFPTWFDFENNVKKIYLNLGYEIVFKAMNYQGDGGVDVRARKRKKSGIEEILIQCKCWKNPVGPDVVRELLGSLVDFADNDVPLKGAIYTTSHFTSGAIELANKHNIELYDEAHISSKVL